MPPVKPNLPAIPVATLNARVDALKRVLDAAKTSDGGIDLEKARRGLYEPAVQKALEAISDAFTAQGARPRVKLDASEATVLNQQFQHVKAAVARFDEDKDGVVEWGENGPPIGASTHLQDVVAIALIEANRDPFKAQFAEWTKSLEDIQHKVSSRISADHGAHGIIKHHVKSELGEQAVLWYFRDLISQAKTLPGNHLNDKLRGAETSFFRFFTYNDRDHLSDGEVKKMLGTSDLKAYVAGKKAEITARLGMDYETDFLSGKDIPGADALLDPHFRAEYESKLRPLDDYSDS